jgi:hypothetical protein
VSRDVRSSRGRESRAAVGACKGGWRVIAEQQAHTVMTVKREGEREREREISRERERESSESTESSAHRVHRAYTEPLSSHAEPETERRTTRRATRLLLAAGKSADNRHTT